jgi:hypothetical protein
MPRTFIAGFLLLILGGILAVGGCDKEKIVESTEYIHNTEYIELPPDTVFQVDTIFINDSTTIHTTDTVFQIDTVVQVNNVYDTVTITVTDTVLMNQCEPNEHLAFAALQHYSDPLVFEFIYNEFAIEGGWVFYLSEYQLDMTKQSTSVYDIYGYIDYWMTDWSGYYPLEFLWRMTYTGGDPADANNWQMSDPPGAAPGHQPGIRMTQNPTQLQPVRR